MSERERERDLHSSTHPWSGARIWCEGVGDCGYPGWVLYGLKNYDGFSWPF